jgi:hypothetical protein
MHRVVFLATALLLSPLPAFGNSESIRDELNPYKDKIVEIYFPAGQVNNAIVGTVTYIGADHLLLTNSLNTRDVVPFANIAYIRPRP